MTKLFIDLAIPIAVNQLFTYNVPAQFHSQVKLGIRVLAPFCKKTVTGIIINIKDKTNVTSLKDIIDVLDTEPLISDEMLKLSKWISDYYFAPLGEALKIALPRRTVSESKRFISLITKDLNTALIKTTGSPKQAEILNILSNVKELSITQLQKKLSAKNIYYPVNELVSKGIVAIMEKLTSDRNKPKTHKVILTDKNSKKTWKEWIEKHPDPTEKRFIKQIAVINCLLKFEEGKSIFLTDLVKQSGSSLSSINTLEKNNIIKIDLQEIKRFTQYDLHGIVQQNIILNQHQAEAFNQLRSAIDDNKFRSFLLHGVTGSGKTQVYIEVIKHAVEKGKTAIVLVPEISLTPQIVARFQLHFGDKVAVLHSKMSTGERSDAWRLAKRGDCSIVIGPRSAIFAPLKNIGLIVVDEEQESSYKQFDKTPRYHARDVAVMRAVENNAVVVLGSATPSIESYHNAQSGKYKLIELPDRVDNAQLPEIEIVDMIAERQKKFEIFRAERKAKFEKDPVAARASKRKPDFGSISDMLKEKIEDRLTRKEGVILLQNRRGFSAFVECYDCGHIEMCEHCNVTLTYHSTKKHLRCHYCGYVKVPPEVCPKCLSIQLNYKGFGTQRIEDELQNMFPTASIIRMDLDTTSVKGSHNKILKQFALGEFDILLGTQMVAKGLDFSRVTLVGVISADTQMLLPDFRSAERTFQLLTQVAGRAGRSGALKGEVVIQTFQPNHYSLRHVVDHDFVGFYNEEIKNRKDLNYPPYSRIALIEIKGKNENEVSRHALKIYQLLIAQSKQLKILGPAEAAISKLNNYYRWHILIKDLKSKDPSGKILRDILASTVKNYNSSTMGKSRAVKVIIDIDPVGMM
jgi:primosomal protein N' (replication factor Y)